MNVGSFSVIGQIDRMPVDLKLALTHQHGVLRAVPINSLHGKNLGTIISGETPKEKFAEIMMKNLKLEDSRKDELLNALPTGGFRVVK